MKTTREQINEYGGMLYLVFIVLTVIGMVYFFFFPKYQEIKALAGTIAEQEKESAELKSYLAYLTDLANTTLEVEQDIIDYALPSENDVISFIVTYEGLGKFPGVELSALSITPGLVRSSRPKENQPEGPKEVPIAPVPFDFTLASTVTSEEVLKDFIIEIYDARRFLAIHSANVIFKEDGTLDLSLAASTYYLPPFTVKPSSDLVKKGKNQTAFFDKLKATKAYEHLVLDGVDVGKTDLFTYQ